MVARLQEHVTRRIHREATAKIGEIKKRPWVNGRMKNTSHHLRWRLQFVVLDGWEQPALPPVFLAEVVQISEHYLRALAFRHMKHADAPSIRHVKPDCMASLSFLREKIISRTLIMLVDSST